MVYEDDRVVAFWDANPTAPVHVLIVPRVHIPTLNDIPADDELLAHMGTVARHVAGRLGVLDSGYRFFVNVNRGGGQVIFHLHAHIIAGNDFGMKLIGLAVVVATAFRRIRSVFSGAKKASAP
jgi:histidine triad (HIT) family protein